MAMKIDNSSPQERLNKMKKCIKLGIAISCLSLLVLTGCGNRQFFDTTWNFNRAYITIGDEVINVTIDSWRDFDGSDMIQIRTVEGTTYLTHSVNVILVQD